MVAWNIQTDCGSGEEMPKCAKGNIPNKEPLMPTPLPDYRWQKLGTDLFTLKGVNYLLVVNHVSLYPGSHPAQDHNFTKCCSCVEVNIL